MYPYLYDGQIVIINAHCNIEDLQKDDIVVFKTEDGYAVKRNIALGGDTVSLSSNSLYINSIKVTPYTYDGTYEVVYNLEPNQYFVIGDNYRVSLDSRVFGPIEFSNIIGKVVVAF